MGGSVLSGSADLPGYRRLALTLAADVAAGRYDENTPLPTDTELMTAYGLGRQTVRRAFQDLVADGLVYRVRGRGTFPTAQSGISRTVRSTDSIEQLEEWPGTEMEVISTLELRRDSAHAAKLELDGFVVAQLKVRRWIDNKPYAINTIILPPEIGERLMSEDLIPDGRTPGTVLASVGKVAGPVASAEETVTAILVSEDIAEILHTAHGRPALHIERIYRNSDGAPVEISLTVHASERYEHRLSIQRAGRHGS